MNNNRQFQFGLSMVEILVALVISLFLLGGIVQVYLGNKTTFAFTNALSEVQENGRFALDTISQDMRHIGDWGCIIFDPDETENINDTLSAATVTGYNSDLHDFLDEDGISGTDNLSASLNNSDTLTIRGSKPGQVNVTSPFALTSNKTLTTNRTTTIAAGDILLITRCGTNDLLIDPEADIFTVDAVTINADSTEIEHDTTLSQTYQNDASIKELQTVTYSIKTGASGLPALFRAEFSADEELIDGIENLQVLYGLDTDNDEFPNQYVTSDNIPDNENVVSIRIMLLVQSSDDFVTEEAQTYTYNGADVTPSDRRLRQVFTSTIALRNRIGSS